MKLALYLDPGSVELIGTALDNLHRLTPIQKARPVLDVFEEFARQCNAQPEVKAAISADSTPTSTQ